VLPGGLGEFSTPAKMYYMHRKGRGEWKNGPKWVKSRCSGARERDMSLKPGDEINYVFGPNDPPPWYDLDAPRFSRPRTDKENVQETNRRKKAREKLLKRKQQEDPLATLSPQEEESLQTNDTTKYPRIPGRLWVRSHTPHTTHHTHHTPHTTHHTGYVGSPKGAKQMLWELGHWQPGLTLACCRRILRELPDFKLETSELSNLWRSRGHGFELGVKCHPEMAGCGIEYCWGKVSLYARVTVCACVFVCLLMFVYVCVCCLQGKYEFRNFINTKTTKRAKLIVSVLTALGRTDFEVRYTKKRREAPLPLFRTRR